MFINLEKVPEEMVKERIDPNKDTEVIRLSRKGHIKRYEKALSYIEKDSIVLDAGCGYGYGSSIMARKASKVIAVDVSKEAINYAKKEYNKKNIKYIRNELEKIDLSKFKKFNLVTCFEVLEHVKDPNKVLKTFKKNMAKNSTLLLSIPNGKNTPKNNPYHLKDYTKEDIIMLLNKNGFRIEKIFCQYPLLGSAAEITRKITRYSTNTNKKSGLVPKLFNTIPLVSGVFSRIYTGKLAATARTLYFVATIK